MKFDGKTQVKLYPEVEKQYFTPAKPSTGSTVILNKGTEKTLLDWKPAKERITTVQLYSSCRNLTVI